MLIDCRAIAQSFDERTRAQVARFRERGIAPQMVEILATADGGVRSYSLTKRRKADGLGVDYVALAFDESAAEPAILAEIARCNDDPDVHGIVVGMPVYPHLSGQRLAAAVVAHKDIDGLARENVANLSLNLEADGIAPATALAAIAILEAQTGLAGRRAAVLGRGPTVGRPVAAMLTNRDATVTIVHSRSRDVEALVAEQDIVVSAMGVPSRIPAEAFREGQIVIDCGILFVDGKTRGDFVAAELDARGVRVTPVPGGVGTVTNAVLFANLMKAMALQGIEP